MKTRHHPPHPPAPSPLKEWRRGASSLLPLSTRLVERGFGGEVLLVLLLCLLGCGQKDAAKDSEKSSSESSRQAHKTLYQCAMHHQIIRDHPGVCPICGMTLVEIHEDAEHGGLVRIDPSVIQNIGVRVEAVEERSMAAEIRLDGRVATDESRIRSVSARVAGYVEKLHASVSGQSVREGESLLELYSPDLVSAQEELLQALRYNNDLLQQSARRRLLNWGVSASFMDDLEKTRRTERQVPLVSPISGVLVRKNVVEGQNVQPGTELFQIADLSHVWITARVYQQDLAQVRAGSKAMLTFRNLPGKNFSGVVSFISPEMDPATRTAEIRITLPNTSSMDLRPEMFAEVLLRMKADKAIAIPEQSLIHSGTRNIAVIALGEGRFQPRVVTTGRTANGYVEILEGLDVGDSLVVSAQFLIDSESNLRAAIEQMRVGATHASPEQGGNNAR